VWESSALNIFCSNGFTEALCQLLEEGVFSPSPKVEGKTVRIFP
jgi:hypothetical protein